MSTPRLASNRRRTLIAACCLGALAAILFTVGDYGQAGAAVGPDVTVFAFTDIGNYGSANGFAGYAVGTRSCNRGDTPLNWCSSQSAPCAAGAGLLDHPVIAQNLYRLKNGRFEQIGMSWLKHGFLSTNTPVAGCAGATGQSCTSPPANDAQLGVGCTDPYQSSLNGGRPLGRRSEVNGTTGAFPSPSSPGGPYAVYDQRIKVATTDLDAASNAGATYFAEAQYIANDDASFGNAFNNASYRRVTVGAAPSYALTMTGTFFEQFPAIFAWPAQDTGVILVNADLPGTIVERYQIARKVTDMGGGVWHYEYAVRNHNSDRAARSFSVEFPVATGFSNVGFKGIVHHSGEPYATNDWTSSSTPNTLTWSTDTFAANANAHALRFATMFNFWFDADQPPSDAILNSIGLFKPGDPTSIDVAIVNDLFKDNFESGGLGGWSGGNLGALSQLAQQ